MNAGVVVSYRNSTSNHNAHPGCASVSGLYLIEILHQTTTKDSVIHNVTGLYLIEILHQTTTEAAIPCGFHCCILSKFYIKPQLARSENGPERCCILSKFYIKPQLHVDAQISTMRCILSKFYIKPQPSATPNSCQRVVSYRNSTSNHNTAMCYINGIEVVSYRNSTSNHNVVLFYSHFVLLYLIEILHQTTTSYTKNGIGKELYLIEILHQTTTAAREGATLIGCILSKFYIKPQLVHHLLPCE